jgi:hypothetical protein
MAGQRRHGRVMAAHLAAQAAEGPDSSGSSPLPEDLEKAVAARRRATADFRAMFAPGTEVWEEVAAWAHETGQASARRRMRELLDEAGVEPTFDVEPVVDRLDVEFLFRFGYALAACEEQL